MLDDDPNPFAPDATQVGANPTLGIVALLLTIYSWMLTAVLFAGQWLLGNGWPGALRENVSLGVTCGLSLFVGTVCRRQFRALLHRRKKGSIMLGVGQAGWVVLIALAAGIYGTWLVCVP